MNQPGQLTDLERQLFVAAERGVLQRVEQLLQQDVNVNSVHELGFTPLLRAACHEHVEVVNRLLEAGADHSLRNRRGNDALYQAVNHGHVATVQALVHAGADVNSTNSQGLTALHCALINRDDKRAPSNTEAWETFPEFRTSSIDLYHRTPLSFAAHGGRTELCSLLLGAGADPNIGDGSGSTPLHVAADRELNHLAGAMIRHGANPTLVVARNRQTALHIAVSKGNLEMVKMFVNTSAELDVKDRRGLTPLHSAIRTAHTEMVQVLLEAGADPNTRKANGSSALHMAAKFWTPRMVQLLLQHGARLDTRNGTLQVLIRQAAKIGDMRSVQWLLRGGADLLMRDGSRHIRLHTPLACQDYATWRTGFVRRGEKR